MKWLNRIAARLAIRAGWQKHRYRWACVNGLSHWWDANQLARLPDPIPAGAMMEYLP